MNSKDLRKRRVKGKITGKNNAPRLSVRASLSHIYAQIIDDTKSVTLCSASDLKIKEKATKLEEQK
jgi:large subunit ribosomal protein L18